MISNDEYISIVFKLSGEEDINKLAALNNLIVNRIKILQQISRNIPKATIVTPEVKEEPKTITEISNECNPGV